MQSLTFRSLSFFIAMMCLFIGSRLHSIDSVETASSNNTNPLPIKIAQMLQTFETHHCKHSSHCKRGHKGHRGKQGPQGPQGPQGIPGEITPLTNTIYVDGRTTSTTQDGSIANPYSTIQEAINTIPAGTSSLTKAQGYVIYVASGLYDENLTIILNNNQIEIIALGPVFLVDPNFLTNPMLGTPRNVTVSFTASVPLPTSSPFGDSISFTNVNSKTFYPAAQFQAQIGEFVIVGNLFINDISSVPNVLNAVVYKGAIVFGVDGTGSTNPHIFSLDNAYLFGAINSPQSFIDARDTTFETMDGITPSITALSYGIITTSTINGMTISARPLDITNPGGFLPSANPILGSGIYSSNLKGNLNGPADGTNAFNKAFLLDNATNFWFQQNLSLGIALLQTGSIQVLN